MYQNEWFRMTSTTSSQAWPWDVGYLGAGSLGITMSNKSTGEIP